MKTLQSHAVHGARIELHESDGKPSLYVAEVDGDRLVRDAAAPISVPILRAMLAVIEPSPAVEAIAALARDWTPEACALIERLRRVLYDVSEHKNAAERSAMLDVVAAHMRSTAPMAGRAA